MTPRLWWVTRLYPDPGSTLFVRVIVFRRRRELLSFGRSIGVERVDSRTRGYCSEVIRWRGSRRQPVVAVVCLWHREMGMGIVSHEFFHATAAWARRRRVDTTELGARNLAGTLQPEDPEEVLAQVHGDLVRQFVAWADDRGLYQLASR